jgi:hypothetical protein
MGSQFGYGDFILQMEGLENRIKEITKEWKIPTKGFGTSDKLHRWINERVDNSKYSLFLDDINQIVKDFNINKNWFFYLWNYILTGKKIENINLRSGKTFNSPRVSVSKEIRVLINANTTQKEYRIAWTDVRKLQRELPDYERKRMRKRKRIEIFFAKQINKGVKFQKAFKSVPHNIAVPELSAAEKIYQRLQKELKVDIKT